MKKPVRFDPGLFYFVFDVNLVKLIPLASNGKSAESALILNKRLS